MIPFQFQGQEQPFYPDLPVSVSISGPYRGRGGSSNALKYKTELCRSFQTHGICTYGPKCQYAHGAKELRSRNRTFKYKTQFCKNMFELGNCHYGDRCNYIHDESEIPPHFHMEMPTQMVYMPSHHAHIPTPPPISSSPPSNKEVVDSVVQAITEKASKQEFSRESSSRSIQSSQSFRESRSAHSSGRSLLSASAPPPGEGGSVGPSSSWNNNTASTSGSTIYVGESRGVQLSDRSMGSIVSERERTPGRTTTFSSFSSEFSPERIGAAGGRNSFAEGEGSYTIQTHGTMLNDAMKHAVQDVVQEIAAKQRTQSPSYAQSSGSLKPPPQIVHVHVHFTQAAAPPSPLQNIQAVPSTIIEPLFGGGLGEGLLRDRSRSLSTSEHRSLSSAAILDPADAAEELSVSSLRLNSL